jgi:hypothetical protein
MPPQQAYGLLDFVNQRLDFRAHGHIVPSIIQSWMERTEARSEPLCSEAHPTKAMRSASTQNG